MTDRPVGDQLDRRLRAGIADIAERAELVDSLDDLLAVTPHEGEGDMLMGSKTRSGRGAWIAVAAVVLLLAGIVGVAVLLSDEDEVEPVDEVPSEVIIGEIDAPAPLLAAELYAADPSAAGLRDLLDSVGGLEALEIAEVVGSFDIVSFDPADADRMLGSKRDGFVTSRYSAQNEDENVLFDLAEADGAPTPFAPDTVHDSVHFNRDGTVTMWFVEEFEGVQPRRFRILDSDGGVRFQSTRGYLNGRWAVTADSAVVMEVDASSYEALTALQVENEDGVTTLARGVCPFRCTREDAPWVDSPTPGVFVVYSPEAGAGSRVIDPASLEEVDHFLAGLDITRAAVSGDGSTALAIGLDGALFQIDPVGGEEGAPFGSVDVGNVASPVTLNGDGTVAVTVDMDGTVSLWHVDSGELVTSFSSESREAVDLRGDLGSTRVTSAVAYDAARVARLDPISGPEGNTWTVIDTDVASWVDRACELAGRALTAEEKSLAGLPEDPGVCG